MENPIETEIVQDIKQAQEEKRVEIFIEKNGKKYCLVMPDPTTIGEAYDAAYGLLARVAQIAQEAAASLEKKPTE